MDYSRPSKAQATDILTSFVEVSSKLMLRMIYCFALEPS